MVVSNTSPLVYLHAVGLLDLLLKLYGRILVPVGVHEEIMEGGRRGVEEPEVEALPWVEIRSVASKAVLPAIADLGKGEAEVIALGKEFDRSLVIMDDRLGREIARICGLAYTGTLGVLLTAKRSGHIEAVAPHLDALKRRGFWIDPLVIRLVLEKSGERI